MRIPRTAAITDTPSFIMGMEFAMRVCRNRYADLESIGGKWEDPGPQAVATCIGMLRLVQVEIGAGRMPLPQFTREEIEEMERIA